MKALKWTLAAAILIVSSTAYAAASNNVTVSHFEPLQRLSIHTASNSSVAVGQKSQQTTAAVLSFDAMGRSFDLQLEPNDRLFSGSSRDALTSGVEIYRGQLANDPDSWARIVVYDGVPRGLVWDGNEMFAIEAPGDSLMQTATPVIYRLADVIIDPGSMTCGVESSPTNAMGTYNKLVRELAAATTATATAAQGPGAVAEITVWAIGDYEFRNAFADDAAAAVAIATRFNNIDGYFSQQVGVQIRLAAPIEMINDPDVPFSTTLDAATLLDDVSLYREATPAQMAHSLTHVYTGRSLTAPTVGIAWKGVLCQDYFGTGLSEGLGGSTIPSLIAAHEIGHNFNADHDGEPAPRSCPLELEDFIMAPAVNTSNVTFSDCSIGVMEAQVVASGPSCVAPLPRVDMSISLVGQSATVLLGADTVLSYDIDHNGTVQATNVTVDFTLPVTLSFDSVTTSMGSCIPGAGGVVNCVLGDVAGLSNSTIDIAVTPMSEGVGMLNATVDSDMNPDERPGNNQVDLQLTVNPAVDLVVNTPTAPTIKIDESTTISAVLENRSILPAIGATLTVTLSNGLQIDSVSWPIGTCMISTQQIDCLVASFDAGLSSTLNVGVTGISTGSKSYTVALSSNEAEANPGDNSVSGTVRVNSPKDSGGATGPLFLWLLAMFTVLARRRLHQRESRLLQ
jgi:hypothetical protein